MLEDRAAGILLHPTSLPGPHGIGDLGDQAFAFVDFLANAKMTRWQMLPLGPTGYGDSPYAAFSSFAGNPLLISLDRLVEQKLLDSADVQPPTDWEGGRVNFWKVMQWKLPLLRTAALRFLNDSRHASPSGSFRQFCQAQSAWLDDYSLFKAVKQVFDGQARAAGVDGAIWNNYWDADIARREPTAMERWTARCQSEVAVQQAWQFFFFEQWQALKQYANQRGILLIGDLPIFVALDSADVWSSPESFCLDADLQPTVVAGVPPDYFSATGQRWGNPVYDWPVMQQSGFAWWIRRFAGTAALVDIIRVDHFRGFEAFWSIPASESTAVHGKWVKSPGRELFAAVRQKLGGLQILAEDLGLITPEVDALREQTGFPGMRVLQFAFDKKEERSRHFLPHNYEPNAVVYTGTHDNNTLRGWFAEAAEDERLAALKYLGQDRQPVKENRIEWHFIRLALGSVARLAIIPIQDILGLGPESRMNTPATMGSNWSWRLPPDYARSDVAQRLAGLNVLFERV